MKQCSKCEQFKEPTEFNSSKDRKDGLTSWCKICVRNRSKIWYNDNSEKVKYKESVTRKGKREWILGIKSSKSCEKCGETHPSCMDFHHLDPTQKDFSISNALYKLHYTRELILAELEKCIVLCANCHRIFHHEERTYGASIDEFLHEEDYLKKYTQPSDFE